MHERASSGPLSPEKTEEIPMRIPGNGGCAVSNHIASTPDLPRARLTPPSGNTLASPEQA